MESVVQGSGLPRVKDNGGAEVDELDSEVVRDDDVLVLDVAMADTDLAERVDDFDDLGKDVLCCRIVEPAVLLDASAGKRGQVQLLFEDDPGDRK